MALLSISEAICAGAGHYCYAEVGSHLGGSLQPHVRDPRCTKIYSIDPRPLEQPDDRWTFKYRYEGNSTERMLELLSAIPGADTAKIQTFEASSWDLAQDSMAEPADFVFIDGEHTNTAVIRDFIAMRRFLSPLAVMAFHDCFVTPAAFLKIARMLRSENRTHWIKYFPRSNVVAIVFDPSLNAQLQNLGWQDGLPVTALDAVKIMVNKRFSWAVKIVRKLKG
ncbi:MAG: class I SAM-dependent methyltransferase [Verrucomicrobiota bacterium]